jgi:hypothetical protein
MPAYLDILYAFRSDGVDLSFGDPGRLERLQ